MGRRPRPRVCQDDAETASVIVTVQQEGKKEGERKGGETVNDYYRVEENNEEKEKKEEEKIQQPAVVAVVARTKRKYTRRSPRLMKKKEEEMMSLVSPPPPPPLSPRSSSPLLVSSYRPYHSQLLNYDFLRTFGFPDRNCEESLLYSIGVAFRHYRDILNREDGRVTCMESDLAQRCTLNDWWSIQHGNIARRGMRDLCRLRANDLLQWTSELEEMKVPEEDKSLFLYFIDKYRDTFLDMVDEMFFFVADDDHDDDGAGDFWNGNESGGGDSYRRQDLDWVHAKWNETIISFLSFGIDQLEQRLPSNYPKCSDSEKQVAIHHHLQHLGMPLFWKIQESAFAKWTDSIREGALTLTRQATKDHDDDNSSPVTTLLLDVLPILLEQLRVNILVLDGQKDGTPSREWMGQLPPMNASFPCLLLLYNADQSRRFESLCKKVKYSEHPSFLTRFFDAEDPFVITYLAYLDN